MTPGKYDDNLETPETCGACDYWRFLYTTIAEISFGVCTEYSNQVKRVIVEASTVRPPTCRAWIADASHWGPLPRELATVRPRPGRLALTRDLFGGPPS